MRKSLLAAIAAGAVSLTGPMARAGTVDVDTGLTSYFDFDGDLQDASVGLVGGTAFDATYNGTLPAGARFVSGVPLGESASGGSTTPPTVTEFPVTFTGLVGDALFLGGDTPEMDHLVVPGLRLGAADQSFSVNLWAAMGEDQTAMNNKSEALGGNGPALFSNKPVRFLQDDTLTVDGGADTGFAYGTWSDAGDDYGVNASDGTNSASVGDQDVGFDNYFMFTLVVDRAANEIRRYQNGVLEQTIDITGWGSLDSGEDLRIGGFPIDTSEVDIDPPNGVFTDATDTYWGAIDEFAVWDGRALDDQTIADVFAAGTQFAKGIFDLSANGGNFSLPDEAPDAIFIGAAADNNASNNDNWQGGFGPATWVRPGQDDNMDGVPDFVGGTRVLIGAGSAEADPVEYDDTETRTVSNWIIAPAEDLDGVSFDETVYVNMTDGTLVGQGDSDSFIGAGRSLVLNMTGDAKLDHNGGAEEASELQVGDGDSSATVVVNMFDNAEIASGNYNPVIDNDPNDPFWDNRILDVRRRRLGDLGFDNGTPIDPQRWGDDVKIGEGANVDFTMHNQSRVVVTDVFYANDQPGADAEVNITLNDESRIVVMWDTRIHDDPQTSKTVITLNDSAEFLAAFDHGIGEAGTEYVPTLLGDGTANPDARPSGRERYEIELNVNDDAVFAAGDRVWIGAGSDRVIPEIVDGEGFQPVFNEQGDRIGTRVMGRVTVNLNDNGLIKAGNDDGDFNAVDGTGSDAITRIGDFFIQMGHGADATVNVNGEGAVMEATRHIFVGSGERGRARVFQNAGLVRTLGTAQGSIDEPFALAGNNADLNYRPERGWLDRGGQIAVGYDTVGEYHALGGELTPATELLVGAQPGGQGFVMIDGATVAVGRDTIIGDLASQADPAFAGQGTVQLISGSLTSRDVRVGSEGQGTFILTGTDAGGATAQFTGDLSFGGDFEEALGGSGVLAASFQGANLPTLDGVGGAFASGASESNLLIWDGTVEATLDVPYAEYRPTAGDQWVLIEFGGDRTGAFAGVTDATVDGVEWAIQYIDEDDENPISRVLLEAVTVYDPGDADLDGDVDAFDLGIWQTGFGTTEDAVFADADNDNDGDVDAFDLGIWQANFGGSASLAAVPEPATAALIVLGGLLAMPRRRR